MKIFELPDLIKPISAENVTGINLREHALANNSYYQLKDLRQQARQLERKFMQQETNDNGMQYWQQLFTLACNTLANETKDLEIAAWLIEAAIRIFQFSGLAQAFALTSELIQQYWSALYPASDPSDEFAKINALIGLNGIDKPGTLIDAIRNVSITLDGKFYFWQYQNLNSAQITEAELLISASHSGLKFYQDLLQDILLAREEFSKLENTVATYCSVDSMPTSYINQTMLYAEMAINNLMQTANLQTQPSEINTSQENKITSFDRNKLMIHSRAEAILILKNLSEFFLTSEPHSPLAYLLQRAIRWSSLTLPELLEEIIGEKDTQKSLSKIIGIQFN